MQTPTDVAWLGIVLAISVGLATIGVCIFSTACFDIRTFYLSFQEDFMTKKIKFIIFLCLTLLFSTLLTACFSTNDSNEDKDQESNNPDTPVISTTVADENEWYDVFAIENFSSNQIATSAGNVLF